MDLDIHILFDGQLDIGHAQLLALEDVGGALHTVEHGSQHFGGFHPVLPVIAPPGNDARQVMVVHKQTVPAHTIQALLPAA